MGILIYVIIMVWGNFWWLLIPKKEALSISDAIYASSIMCFWILFSLRIVAKFEKWFDSKLK